MSSKLAFNQEILRSQEAAFIEHYDWLKGWALHLTHDRARAEDLVQEVFAAFAIAHTDLSAVQNMRGYLYRTLRNIHVSEVRLAGRSHNHTRSIVEYSVAEAALAATDPYTIFYTQDQLRRICQYACLRKQSSRAGSVLILRYFHGYLSSEIAQVVGGTSQSVRQNLKFARNEAKAFLEDPGTLKFIEKTPGVTAPPQGTICPTDRLLAELRRAIFDSCEGDCCGSEFIRKLYGERLICSADNALLAHLVSCPVCLDLVNSRLGLPLLAERHPADTLGPHNDWRDGTRGPRGLGGNGGGVSSRRRVNNRPSNKDPKSTDSLLSQCRRRATELFEHHPAELCVSVNGHVLGSQAVNSEVSRLRLDVTIAEELEFVEVLSEERVRLLVMPVQSPPEGEPVQTREVSLSEGRHLEVTFRHGHPWPMVEVVYEEPNFSAELQPAAAAFVPRLVEATAPEPASLSNEETAVFKARALQHVFRDGIAAYFRSFNLPRRPFWFQPNFITAIISVVLIAALLTFWFRDTPAVTAASLLERAGAAETLPVPTDVAVHRVLELEQRRRGSGELVSKHRIEIWRDDEKNLAVRRVYDSNGRLIAGVLAEGNGDKDGRSLRRIYRQGGQRIETGLPDPSQSIRAAELWQLQPSAREYVALLHHPQKARLSETADSYVISYDAHDTAQPAASLLHATLTLRKSDLHPTAQTFAISDGREIHDYRLQEVSFERPALRSVSPQVFELGAEFVSTTRGVKAISVPERREASAVAPTVPVGASAELELNVAYALDQFRTRFGDQLTLTKTSAGLLEVRGVVDSDETRKEILKALESVSDDPAAIKVRVETTSEVLVREQPRSDRVIVREFSGSDQSIPLYADLRRYFSAQVQTDQHLDQLVREFAARVVSRSQRALGHSLELKQLSSRFSAIELEQLTPSARTKWASLVRNHAEALRRELTTLDGELQRTLSANASRPPSGEAEAISDDTSLLVAIGRLHELVLVTDQIVRASFAASSAASATDVIKGSQFRIRLITSAAIADEVRQAAGK